MSGVTANAGLNGTHRAAAWLADRTLLLAGVSHDQHAEQDCS